MYLVAFGNGVISGARLDLVVFIGGVDFHFAKTSVKGRVGGRVADVVLTAQLVGDLVESLFQLFIFISDFNDPASGFLSHLFHFALTGVAAETAVKTAVRTKQY